MGNPTDKETDCRPKKRRKWPGSPRAVWGVVVKSTRTLATKNVVARNSGIFLLLIQGSGLVEGCFWVSACWRVED